MLHVPRRHGRPRRLPACEVTSTKTKRYEMSIRTRVHPRIDGDGLASSVGRLSGARLLNVAASFAGAILVTRALGPNDRGIYSLVTSLSALAVLIFTMGLPAALTWQIARGKKLQRPAWVFLGVPGFAASCSVLVLIGLHTLAEGSAYGQVPLVATCLLVGALSIGVLLRSALTGLHDYKTLSRMLSSYAIVTAAGTALVALVTHSLRPTIFAAISGSCVVYAWYFTRLRSVWRSLPSRVVASQSETRRFAGLSWITNLIQQVNLSFGLLALGASSPAHEVGLYAAATALAQVLWLLPSAASEIAFAEAAKGGHSSSAAHFRMLTSGYLWTVAGVSTVGALLLWPLSYFLVPVVLGQEFAGAVTPLLLLLPGVVAFSIAQVGGNVIAGSGRMRLNLISSTASALVTVVSGLVLIPRWGSEGAAITSSMSYLVATLCTLAFIRHINRTLSRLWRDGEKGSSTVGDAPMPR